MDPEIRNICGKKIVVLVSWFEHSDYKKKEKNYISGKKHEKNVLKKWVKKLIVLRVS